MRSFLLRMSGFAAFIVASASVIYAINVSVLDRVVVEIPAETTNLLIGHSQVRGSLDPAIVKTSIHATHGAEPYFLNYLKLRHILYRNPHIKKVVLGFSPADFSAYQDEKLLRQPWMVTFFDRYLPILELNELRWAKVNWPIFARRWVNGWLLPNTDYIKLLFQKRDGQSVAPKQIPFFGYFQTYQTPRLLELMKIEGYPEQPSGVSDRHYYVDGKQRELSTMQLESFRRIVELCRDKRVHLFLYAPPLHHWYREHVPSTFKAHYRAVRERYRKMAHVDVIDLSALELQAEDFWDVEHVNVRGMRIASRRVNEILNKPSSK